MPKPYSCFIVFLLFSCFVYGQNDSISSKELKKRKKLIKYQKTTTYNDTLVLANNDVLVGELKHMDRSVLTFKTKYSDKDFKIKWLKISEIQSDRIFLISLEDGEKLTSALHSNKNKKGKIFLDSGVIAIEENLINIVYLEPLGKNFLSRLTVDMDIGVTLTKANNLKQLTTNISSTYIGNKWKSNASFKTVLSRQDSIADIKRFDGSIRGQISVLKDWFVQADAIYLANDEQKLQLRSTYKVGMGYFFVHNSKMYFASNAGIAYTSEIFTNDTPARNSSELYISIGFNKYSIGDLSISTTAILYPSLSQSGRYRTDFNFDMKYDLPLDFYIKMSLTYNFDNQPIAGAANSDYVFTTSFGWEFN